jgi:hypothetical protein
MPIHPQITNNTSIVYALNKNEFYDNFSINVPAIRFFCLFDGA